MRELHRVLRAPLGERTQLIDVAKHVGERDDRLDNLRVAAAVGSLDLPAPAVDVADDVAEIILGSDALDLHYRLEQLDAGLVRRFAHRSARADFKGERR